MKKEALASTSLGLSDLGFKVFLGLIGALQSHPHTVKRILQAACHRRKPGHAVSLTLKRRETLCPASVGF